jgi:hypothetical protein
LDAKKENDAYIYHIDGEGVTTHHHELNFAAIGIGSPHAKSYLMFSRYQKLTSYFRALPVLYGAKKQAETAPGVGAETDYYLINKTSIIRVPDEIIEVIAEHYAEEERRKAKDIEIIEQKLGTATDAFLAKLNLSQPVETGEQASSDAVEPKQGGLIPPPGAQDDGKPA